WQWGRSLSGGGGIPLPPGRKLRLEKGGWENPEDKTEVGSSLRVESRPPQFSTLWLDDKLTTVSSNLQSTSIGNFPARFIELAFPVERFTSTGSYSTIQLFLRWICETVFHSFCDTVLPVFGRQSAC